MAGSKRRKESRSARGLGSVHWETARQKWVAEKWVRLADGTLKRVRARHEDQKTAIELRDAKARVAELETRESSAVTLNRLLDDWLADLKPTVTTSTHNDYRDTMKLHVRPHIGGLLAGRVTAEDVREVLGRLMRRKPPAIATAHKVRTQLSQVFIWAVRRDRVVSNPVAKVEPVRRRQKPAQAWSEREAAAFLKACEGDPLYALFYTAIATGMRKGELLALMWTDISRDEINVQRTISKGAAGGVKEGAKTLEGNRLLPVSPALASVLDSQRAVAAKSHTPELVFPSTTRGRLSGSHVSKRMRSIAAAANVKRIRFHDIRKTTTSMWARAGVPPAVTQVLLGHATPDLALRVYTEVRAEDVKRAALDLTALGGRRGGQVGGLPSARDHTPRVRREGRVRRAGSLRTGRSRSRH